MSLQFYHQGDLQNELNKVGCTNDFLSKYEVKLAEFPDIAIKLGYNIAINLEYVEIPFLISQVCDIQPIIRNVNGYTFKVGTRKTMVGYFILMIVKHKQHVVFGDADMYELAKQYYSASQ